MADRAVKVVVVHAADGAETVSVASLDQCLEHLDGATATTRTSAGDDDDIDLVMLVIGDRGIEVLKQIGDIRQKLPAVPIIVVTNDRDDSIALAALRAGAQDCLVRSEMEEHRPLLARAVQFAVERGSYLKDRDRTRRDLARDRDVEALQAIFAGGKLSITERSLGQLSVRERHPADFRSLVQDYGQILDTVVAPSVASASSARTAEPGMMLNVIADRLGLLGAGPRDVVELHKSALAPRIEGRDSRAARRALSYIEEGKLLVLQLMGQLVLFYRSLTWGTKPPSGSPVGRKPPAAGASFGDQ